MFEPKVKKMNWFVLFITFGWAAGITLAPFGIYLKKKYMPPYRNHMGIVKHESIHWKQQLEMLIIFFYFWYLIEWIIRIFTNFGNAYKSISFEREAYANEGNENYLKTRKRFAWLKYIKNEK